MGDIESGNKGGIAVSWPFKIMVKYATRGRKERFFGGMDTIYSLASQPDYIYTVVTADEDDPEMNNDEVRTRLSAYPNTTIIYGLSENKIHAINRDFEKLPDKIKDWDIVVNFSDDQRFVTPNWDDHVRIDINSVFPETLDGFMAYFDPDTKGILATLYVAGRAFYERFSFIYDPQFQSLFCDNLIEDCAKELGKWHYTGFQICHHYNSAYGYADFPKDEMFIKQQDIGWSVDQNLYYKIKSEGIDKYLLKFKR